MSAETVPILRMLLEVSAGKMRLSRPFVAYAVTPQRAAQIKGLRNTDDQRTCTLDILSSNAMLQVTIMT